MKLLFGISRLSSGTYRIGANKYKYEPVGKINYIVFDFIYPDRFMTVTKYRKWIKKI